MMPAQRFPTNENASVEVYGRLGTYRTTLRNLSASGACLEWMSTQLPVDKGDLLRIMIDLKSVGKVRHVSAEVVWNHEGKTGINFLSPDKVLEKMLEKV